MAFSEKFPVSIERGLFLQRFSEIGILYQIRSAAAHQARIEDEDTIDAMTVLLAWFHTEPRPNSEKDIREVLGDGAHVPQLVIDCSWSAIGGGREAYMVSVFDDELQLDTGQIEQIVIWACEREPLVYRY